MKSKNKVLLIIFALVTGICSGCSNMVYENVSESTADAKSTGIRYYNSSPYLMVYSNGKGGLITQIVYLPDPKKKMSATPKTFLASLQTTMEFEKGVYQTGKNTADGTMVPAAIVKAVETIAPILLAANEASPSERMLPAPYIYKIVVQGTQVSFVGGKGDKNIKVNILQQTQAKTK